MGPLLVLVSPCFRENVAVTCKIGSFLCSLNNLLQKKGNCFLFWKSNFKMALIWKRGFWTYFSHFLVTRESYKNSFSTYLTHIHTYMYFAHPINFFALPILKKIRIYQVWFLFGVIPGVDSYSRHFVIDNEMVSKI